MKKILSLILALLLLCGTALADTSQVITMDTSNVPAIPEGTLSAEVVSYRQSDLCRLFCAEQEKYTRSKRPRPRQHKRLDSSVWL